jgi:hypothetical protein
MAYNLNRKVGVTGTVDDVAAIMQKTLDAFKSAETACSQLNKECRLNGLLEKDHWVLLRARQLIVDTIGAAPPVDWFREASFSGGASTSRKRSEAHPAVKWWASPSLHVTPLALRHLLALAEDMGDLAAVWANPGQLSCDSPCTNRSPFTIVPGSRLDTVEKSYKVRRTILIEPDGNMLLQKALGSIIRRCLKLKGINLNDQSRNQILAFAGSITGLLGTIDLAAASDSISLFIARLLLPEAWYELLYELRSPLFQGPDGTWTKLEKLSSMGNGFTFEVESLLFWALTQGTVDVYKPSDRRVGVYGDDIVVATECCDRLARILSTCGFKLNAEKSFWTGYFRESCGKHYHNGTDVTPVYIKGDLDNLEERFRLYNQLRNWEEVLNRDVVLSDIVLEQIAMSDRREVPPGYCETQGLHWSDVSVTPIRLKFDRRRWCHKAIFEVYAPDHVSFADRFDSECKWFYRICERWQPTRVGYYGGVLLDAEYTPVDLVREGERAWRRVTAPWVSQVIP